MERKPVKSSNIRSVGYDPAAKRMEIEFTNGGIYHYDGVTQEAHDDLVNAESVGRHFGAHVRGKYPHKQVY